MQQDFCCKNILRKFANPLRVKKHSEIMLRLSILQVSDKRHACRLGRTSTNAMCFKASSIDLVGFFAYADKINGVKFSKIRFFKFFSAKTYKTIFSQVAFYYAFSIMHTPIFEQILDQNCIK
jgi:hypothetical protein